MKASNTQVMVQAYRLLVKTMVDEGMNYPLHLGVTEAGEAEDGRIKSAVGIGTLLEDGLGDTIRVSLTEEPEAEIPIAKILAERYEQKNDGSRPLLAISTIPYDPFFHTRQNTKNIFNIGGDEVPRVIGDLSDKAFIHYEDLGQFGYLYSPNQDKWHISDLAIDFLYIGSNSIDFEIPGTLGMIQDYYGTSPGEEYFQLYTVKQLDLIPEDRVSFLICSDSDNIISTLKSLPNCILILETDHEYGYAAQRRFFIGCIEQGIKNPVIIKRSYAGYSKDEFLLYSATDLGALQVDGFGDGIWLESEHDKGFINEISFGILQASRTRISKTEYISCPSCGRTLFDLQETTAKIRARTNHLKGVKIGIMGCIVNGPGEMADADYGYVGTGPGQISLYKGQDVVEKNIDVDGAVDSLIQLIDSHGDWVEPGDV
jgi:(E)-4-hydroxy-3-methylbut-2-enyl-diphosphate synthase